MTIKEPPCEAIIGALLARECAELSPYVAARTAATICRSARRLHGIYERQCNGYSDGRGGWNAVAEQRDVKRAHQLHDGVIAAVKDVGLRCSVTFSGDPRGAPVCLTMKADSREYRIA